EVVAQAIVIGLALALPCGIAALVRMSGALALGAMLTAPAAAVVAGVVASSARGAGLSADVVLSHSVHPLTLAQVVIAGFHGNPARLAEERWGGDFFSRGVPHFL